MVVVVSALTAALGIAATVQSVLIFDMRSIDLVENPELNTELIRRFGINLFIAVLAGVAAATLRVHERSVWARSWVIIAIAVLLSCLRAALQTAVGIYHEGDVGQILPDALIVGVLIALFFTIGVLVTVGRRQARRSERQRLAHASRAASAFTSLQREELRVRREIADSLHGSVQNHFVLLEAELADIARQVPHELDARLHSVRQTLAMIREHELRSLGTALYPEGLERGLVPAVRALIARVPAAIATQLTVDAGDDAETPAADELDLEHRLLLVRTVEEALTNALRHGDATAIELTIRLRDDGVDIDFTDDGIGFDEEPVLRGLAVLRERLRYGSGDLELIALPGGGTRLIASLRVTPTALPDTHTVISMEVP